MHKGMGLEIRNLNSFIGTAAPPPADLCPTPSRRAKKREFKLLPKIFTTFLSHAPFLKKLFKNGQRRKERGGEEGEGKEGKGREERETSLLDM